ncbi:hypothetical protein KIN20_032022 [Parelaphostrongylus tenuis]|uniref:Uncharacterized protein n=1 Tax=Parelaphostrongylus tenuis TaxID=148309 RepID=A0AAD5WHR0_PARTN|nr:hypothetical protein KIN20_032022 [Parelaphostrongylus tenuis]
MELREACSVNLMERVTAEFQRYGSKVGARCNRRHCGQENKCYDGTVYANRPQLDYRVLNIPSLRLHEIIEQG